jgi:hypothetical protein
MRTDEHYEANSRFSQVGNAPKNAAVYCDVEGTTEPCCTEEVPVHTRSFRARLVRVRLEAAAANCCGPAL